MAYKKQVQIPITLFRQLVAYHLLEDYSTEKQIEDALENKLEMLVRHELYSKYKVSGDAKEREAARKEYLQRIGMHEDFIWTDPSAEG